MDAWSQNSKLMFLIEACDSFSSPLVDEDFYVTPNLKYFIKLFKYLERIYICF